MNAFNRHKPTDFGLKEIKNLRKKMKIQLFWVLGLFIILYLKSFSANAIIYASAINSENTINKIIAQAKDLRPEILKLALHANACFRKQGRNMKNLLTILDYSLPSSKRRFWVIDLNTQEVIFSLCAAHGKGTGDHWAISFSDKLHSHQSSLGVFRTGKIYYGKHGLSLELFGLEPGFNSSAYHRRVVMHAAWYVSEAMVQKTGRIGRSFGCPALNPNYAQPVINRINNDTLFFAYYPNDKWLTESKFLNCSLYK